MMGLPTTKTGVKNESFIRIIPLIFCRRERRALASSFEPSAKHGRSGGAGRKQLLVQT